MGSPRSFAAALGDRGLPRAVVLSGGSAGSLSTPTRTTPRQFVSGNAKLGIAGPQLLSRPAAPLSHLHECENRIRMTITGLETQHYQSSFRFGPNRRHPPTT